MSLSVGGNEIITVCVGQCGIALGNEFYSTIMEECKIDRNGMFIGDVNNHNDSQLMDKHTTYFTSQSTAAKDASVKYIPRAIFCDLDCTPVDRMRTSFFGSLMATDNFISSEKSMGSMTWAHGHYTDGAEHIYECMEKMRNSIELCDYLQGFEMMHGQSGGVGGGFGSLMLMKLRDNYPSKQLFAYSVYPSRSFYEERNTNIVSYNTLLSCHMFTENSDLCFIIDNGRVLSLLNNNDATNITMDDINYLISFVISGANAPFRFYTEPNLYGSLKSMCSNFVAFPRLHWVSMSASPIVSRSHVDYDMNVNKTLNQLLFKNEVTDVKFEDGKILNLAIHYRGNAMIHKMEQFIARQQVDTRFNFVKWIPPKIQSCLVYDGDNFCYKQHSPIITTAIHQTTAIKSVFQRISTNFAKVYKRRGYLHWYKGQGMDEMEFQEADKNIRDLITEYQDKQDIVIDEDEDEDDEGNDDGNENEQKYTANDDF
eukprot:500066_1